MVFVDYVTKLLKAIACVSNDALTISNFLKKNVFARFRVPRVLISDGGHIFAQIHEKCVG